MQLPPQAIMCLTPQQVAAQTQARVAWIQHEQARLAYQRMQRQQQVRSAMNSNSKRPRDQPQVYTAGPDFGTLVPERLQKSHGQFLKVQLEMKVTP
jgi:hypothetical protein